MPDPAPHLEVIGATPVLDAGGAVVAVVLEVTTCVRLTLDTAEVHSIDMRVEPPRVIAVEGVVTAGRTMEPGTIHQETVEFEAPSSAQDYAASFVSNDVKYGVRLRQAASMIEGEIAVAKGVIARSEFDEMSHDLCS